MLKTVVLGPILRLLFRPWVEGAEHIPETGAAIFASNHLSFSDSIFLPLVVDRRVTFLAKSDYFTGVGIKGRLTAAFFRGVGQVPVDRSGGKASEAALSSGLKILRRGEVLALYPEGTRSPDGRLYKGRTGVAFLALQTGAPVVPVGLIGTDRVMPVGAKMPSMKERVTVRFGEPLDLAHHGPADSGRARRLATDDIMAAIHALSGQELANAYNESPAHGIDRIKQVLPHERR